MPHERVWIEQSLKYSEEEKTKLWKLAGLTEMGYWSRGDEYGLHLLKKSSMPFSLIPSLYAAKPLPTVHDWKALWKAWDIVTKDMIADEELQEKPIKLRNACIFYLGHIPTFLDIQLTKTTGQPPTDPASYYSIFERGIDPDVDNPEHCHSHSVIPDEWPSVQEITEYQGRVRSRLQKLYQNDQDKIPREIGRAIWVGFEHELMHIETLLYMMLQSNKTLPPPHTVQPDFAKMAQQARTMLESLTSGLMFLNRQSRWAWMIPRMALTSRVTLAGITRNQHVKRTSMHSKLKADLSPMKSMLNTCTTPTSIEFQFHGPQSLLTSKMGLPTVTTLMAM
ncbi:hypothetical protein NXS19_009344 [Fusarium pseudograminearum]|nr:hypothetical protein NXS19_009344 [Fusarium pseudograminearum]